MTHAIHRKHGRPECLFTRNRIAIASAAFAVLAASTSGALAQKKYDTGATDTEIKIGNIMPYSGPASAYGVIGKTEAAYFKKINDAGGINGRKINFISYDDGYSPPKTVEQARKLVESDEVLFVFNSLGTPPNSAIHKYMNSKKVPQLFVATGATKWNDPKDFPWTMGWQPNYQSETQIYAKYLLKEKPERQDRRAVSERRLRQGLSEGPEGWTRRQGRLDDCQPRKASRPPNPRSTTTSSSSNRPAPTSSSISRRRNSRPRRSRRWRRSSGSRCIFLNNVSASVGSVIKPAGYENSQDIISAAYLKDASDPQWDNDPGMKEFYDVPREGFSGRQQARRLGRGRLRRLRRPWFKVLQMCGDNLTRENVMKQAASLKDFRTEVLLPGIKINTGPTDFAPISQLQLMKFKGEKWELFGDIISADVGG